MKTVLNLIARFALHLQAVFAEFGNQVSIPGLSANADLSAPGKQYIAVRFAGSNLINIASEVGGVSGVNKAGIGVL